MVERGLVGVRAWRHGVWRPGLRFGWPAGPTRRVLLLGLSPVQGHAWHGRFLNHLPAETLQVVESSSQPGVGGQEWLNFSSQVVSAGDVEARLSAWSTVEARLLELPQPVVMTASALSPAWKVVSVVARVWPRVPFLLLDVPGHTSLEDLCASDREPGLGSAGWDVVIARPFGMKTSAVLNLCAALGVTDRRVSQGVQELGERELVAFAGAQRFRLACPESV